VIHGAVPFKAPKKKLPYVEDGTQMVADSGFIFTYLPMEISWMKTISLRTLDIIYGWGGACDYCPPPPMCFTDRGLLARLSPSARNFFDYFISAYSGVLESGTLLN
jgi:hypothetical protein